VYQLSRRDPSHALNPAADRPGPPAAVDADLIGAILATLDERTAPTYLADDRDPARPLGRAGSSLACPRIASSRRLSMIGGTGST
jgi:hypothetical protein